MILAIYGAGGLGRELIYLADIINNKTCLWTEIYLIDDYSEDTDFKGHKMMSFEVMKGALGSNQTEFVVGVGEPSSREILADRVKTQGYKLASLIHPNAQIPAGASIGEGVIVGANVVVTCDDIKIGENVLIQSNAIISHDVEVGSHSVIAPAVSTGGGCKIGTRTYVGMNATIKERINVGDDVIIGMGSTVVNDIPKGMIVFGNPARIVRENVNKKVFKN